MPHDSQAVYKDVQGCTEVYRDVQKYSEITVPSQVRRKGNVMDRVKHIPNDALNLLPLPVCTRPSNLFPRPPPIKNASYLDSSLYSKMRSLVDTMEPGSSVPTTISGGCTLWQQQAHSSANFGIK